MDYNRKSTLYSPIFRDGLHLIKRAGNGARKAEETGDRKSNVGNMFVLLEN